MLLRLCCLDCLLLLYLRTADDLLHGVCGSYHLLGDRIGRLLWHLPQPRFGLRYDHDHATKSHPKRTDAGRLPRGKGIHLGVLMRESPHNASTMNAVICD
uniref:Secreted protein n=1 Tax=Anopheles quadriannulatus TaxID=34691 RepID=A0A182WZL6_ANOQN